MPIVKVYRFSVDGFISKNQTFHRGKLQFFHKPVDLSNLNDYQKEMVKETDLKIKKSLQTIKMEDWDYGLWVFLSELPKNQWVNHELNHLSIEEKEKRSLFIAELSVDAEIYSPYRLVPELFTVKSFLEKFGPGNACYIPERSLCKLYHDTIKLIE